MEKHNRDLMPEQSARELFAEVAPLIANPRIVRAFARCEARALRAKRLYHGIGRLGMAMSLIGTLYTVADALVLPPFIQRDACSLAAILIGLGGLILQILLIVSRTKHHWLLSRFAAERIRSIAFQAYPLAVGAPDTAALAGAVDRFYEQALAYLDLELNAGIAALDLFRPESALLKGTCETGVAPLSPAQPARAAYLQLRLDYQRRFAAGELARLREGEHFNERVSDLLYIAGGGLALAALTVKLLAPDALAASSWIGFVAITSFIVGLAATIFEGASLGTPSRDRLVQYASALDALEAASAERGLARIVHDCELVVLCELREFCKAAQRISYRL